MFNTLLASLHSPPPNPPELKYILHSEVAIGSKRLDTLVTAVKAAGLVEALAGDGPFTVFAPTDAAFARLGEEARNLCFNLRSAGVDSDGDHHVVAGRFDANREFFLGRLH